MCLNPTSLEEPHQSGYILDLHRPLLHSEQKLLESVQRNNVELLTHHLEFMVDKPVAVNNELVEVTTWLQLQPCHPGAFSFLLLFLLLHNLLPFLVHNRQVFRQWGHLLYL